VVHRKIKSDKVKEHGRLGRDRRVLGELDQVEQGRHVLIEVDVRVPLGEAEAQLAVQPALGQRLGVGQVLAAGHAVLRVFEVGEDGIGKHLPGHQFGRMEENLVVLRPPLHIARAALVQPVLEAQDRLLDFGPQIVRQARLAPVECEHAQDRLQVEIHRPVTVPNLLQESVPSLKVEVARGEVGSAGLVVDPAAPGTGVRGAVIQVRGLPFQKPG